MGFHHFGPGGGRPGEAMDIDEDPFNSFGGMHGHNQFGNFDGPPGMRLHKKQDTALTYDLQVSLEEIYRGTTKKMKITRKILNPDGRSTRPEDKVLTIDIKPGWKAGTKITFPKEGDQTPNNIPADIVFIVKDKPHSVFTRDGSDIRYKAKIGLREALVGTSVQIPTLDGRKKSLRLTDVTKPNTMRRIQGEGLPFPKQPTRKGDLIVEFDIKFPDSLSSNAKEIISDTLPRTNIT